MDRADYTSLLIAFPTMLGLVFVAMLVYQLREVILEGVKGIIARYVRVQQPAGVAVWDMQAGAAAIEAAAHEDRREAAARREMVADAVAVSADRPADRQTDAVSDVDPTLARLQVDRTRTALLETAVKAGWDVGEIRNAIKGDNGTIGKEIAAARERLGQVDPPRVIPSREHIDGQLVEREIVME